MIKICMRLRMVKSTHASRRRLVLVAGATAFVLIGIIVFISHLMSIRDYSSSEAWKMLSESVYEKADPNDEYRFPLFAKNALIGQGKRFDEIKYGKFLKEWKLRDCDVYERNPVNESETVIIMYSSSNHYDEAKAALVSWRSQTNMIIVFYDIGLTKRQRDELTTVCQLELRKFDFNKYPDYVQTLSEYRFKAIILAEVFSEFRSFYFFDTSTRSKGQLPEFFKQASEKSTSPFALGESAGHSIFAATNPGMYAYLPLSTENAFSDMRLTTFFVQQSTYSRDIAKWYALCALEKDCMVPSKSRLYCNFGDDRQSTYAQCHRYDQSAMNIIVASLNEKTEYSGFENINMTMFLSTQREDYYSGELKRLTCR